MGNDVPRSWRRGNALAFWTFQLCEPEPAQELSPCPKDEHVRSRWIGERLQRFLEILPPLAAAEEVTIITSVRGEDAYVVIMGESNSREILDSIIAREGTIIGASIALTLNCVEIDEANNALPIKIQSGADAYIEMDQDIHGNVVVEAETGIQLTFMLHIDIFSPRNPCMRSDNEKLARLNAPLLCDFLQRLRTGLPARFVSLHGEDYVGVISPSGFVVP